MAAVRSAAQVLDRKIIELSWAQVYDRLRHAPRGKLYGVPRGGAIVAGLTGRAVEHAEEADYIVDDVLDSGTTAKRYESFGKPFWPLIDKHAMGLNGEWIVFPWEEKNQHQDIADTVTRQLEYLGEDPRRDGLVDTPRRVIKSLVELTRGYTEKPEDILSKTFDVAYDEMVVLRDIEFWSLCEHHMLPFHGTATIGYLPVKRVVGISKLARLVSCFSRRLQVQERLTQEIAHAIDQYLKPQGVGVVLRATHLCMALRGVRTPADMVTSCLLGHMRTEQETRAEFLELARSKKNS